RRAVGDDGDLGTIVRAGPGRRSAAEQLTATAALAIAAQQRGDTEMATRLGETVARRSYALMRLGGESAFWLLAAASYGAWGLDPPERVEISAGGRTQTLALVNGRAMVAFPLDHASGADASVRIVDGAATSRALVRLEASGDGSYGSDNHGEVTLAL